MDTAFVVMTALPPTTGHLQLIQFASRIARSVVVIVSTQPSEPYPLERYEAIRDACNSLRASVYHYNFEMEQDPETPGFREMWADIYRWYGCGEGDYIVASETYGKWLAEMTGASFFPYDIDRTLNSVKATTIRNDPLDWFDFIIPEFRKYIQTRVTIFGSESTGKTTLARELRGMFYSEWLFEYARPYLENNSTEITMDAMTAIWMGQRALQEQGSVLDAPILIQDTDLFSTVGYWNIPHWQDKLGSAPAALVADALRLKSDLYIITRSNIPFEEDPLRYGGDVRETDDQYWIDLCEQYGLNYVVLDSIGLDVRLLEAGNLIYPMVTARLNSIQHDRQGH